MSSAANDRELRQIANYVAQQSDMDAVADEILTGFFADPWARSNRWPLKRLAKDPSRFRHRNGNGAAPAASGDPLEVKQLSLETDLAKARLKSDFAEVTRLEAEIRAVASQRRRST